MRTGPGIDRDLPFMAVLALPPNSPVAAVRQLIGSQVAVQCRVPLGQEFGTVLLGAILTQAFSHVLPPSGAENKYYIFNVEAFFTHPSPRQSRPENAKEAQLYFERTFWNFLSCSIFIEHGNGAPFPNFALLYRYSDS